jgi:hypothetical protein
VHLLALKFDVSQNTVDLLVLQLHLNLISDIIPIVLNLLKVPLLLSLEFANSIAKHKSKTLKKISKLNIVGVL